MTENTAQVNSIRLRSPAPAAFDPFAATAMDLARYGLPRRPDPSLEPELAGLWQRKAEQYRQYEHLAPQLGPPRTMPAGRVRGLEPVDCCGYSLTSDEGPFTSLFGTWTVPDLHHDSDLFGINSLEVFMDLGFLDVQVDLTVDASDDVVCHLLVNWHEVVFGVRPGDVMSASLCLETNQAGTAALFVANETTGQMMSFIEDAGYPPARLVDAGVSRAGVMQPGQSLARFGTVYFDDLSAYNIGGRRSLISGEPETMVDTTGAVLADVYALNDYAFKVVWG